jgi:dipeptidyl aminopeptidase/acylaminoacyl peptidase
MFQVLSFPLFASRLALFAFLLVSSLPVLVATSAAASDSLTPEQAALAMAETPQIGDVVLSPDGKWVTYAVTRRSVERNSQETERFLQRVPQRGEYPEKATPLGIPGGAAAVQWRSDGKCLSVILSSAMNGDGRETPRDDTRFACHDIEAGKLHVIPVRGRAVTPNYQWSPSGKYVAFIAPLAERAPLDPRRGVPHGLIEPYRPNALFILDVQSGATTQLTLDSLNVAPFPAFAWSPDEKSIAAAVHNGPKMEAVYDTGDLVVIDVASRRVRVLVDRPGMDAAPCFSPDGRFIAFATHQGDPAYRPGWPAIVSTREGRIIDFPKDSAMGFRSCRWSEDGRAFYYVSPMEMTRRLVRAEPATRRVEALPQASDLALAYEDNRSFSADGRIMAFTRESLTTPPDLFVSFLDETGAPEGAAVRLTNLAPNVALGGGIRVEEVSWPSSDGKFTIHSLLLTPRKVQDKLATLLYIVGGPSMVDRGFFHDGWGSYLPLAARGYAVLIPNTRGREGYGAEFNDGIRTGRSRGRLPLGDGLAGLDLLIKRGIADPDRAAVLGHSYGGYLTAYAITQTHRFKAAVIHDAPLYSTLGLEVGFPRNSWWRLLWRDLCGVQDPFDPEERARIVEENSPGLHAERVKTPTMLISATKNGPLPPYGAVYPNAWRDSGPFYHSLRRFDVPAALLVYDEPHVWQRPAAIADDFTRTAEWLDYWVLGKPFPDPVRAKEYGMEEWGK